ncbi:hypothetical protein DK419_13085 [Methylobacterium terrae]|uniref:Phage tail protein n=1 Tax=Methylobacterium terrae TaxID=2202827 RepID=A0A2U8WNT5_9HYPH|nr:hypothetical protein [Methylobacterium terrae]AWN47130.1 hypothetical protein DK419_13085 [Methylobacterium terrae]
MPGFTPANGTKVFIGPAIDIDTITGATSLTSLTGWVEIKGAKDLGAIGDEASAVTSNQLGVNRTLKGKGTSDAGTPAFVFDYKEGDPGQEAARSAADPGNNFDYSFYIEKPVKKTPGGTTAKLYFAGQVMSAREGGLSANNPITLTVNVGINTTVYRVAAT